MRMALDAKARGAAPSPFTGARDDPTRCPHAQFSGRQIAELLRNKGLSVVADVGACCDGARHCDC